MRRREFITLLGGAVAPFAVSAQEAGRVYRLGFVPPSESRERFRLPALPTTWLASLARPGGNTTGVSILSTELDGKRQELLIELVPGARRMAALFDPAAKSAARLQEMVSAARARGVEISTHRVVKAEDIVPAINAAQADGAAALNVLATVLLHANRQLILERTTALRMPAIYQFPESAEQGGFAAYGPRLEQIYNRQVAVQIARLLRGERPEDLPD